MASSRSALPDPLAWFRARAGASPSSDARPSHRPSTRRRPPEDAGEPSRSDDPAADDDPLLRAAPAPAQRPVTREELGRATWLLLHPLAAQFPDAPTREEARDARDLIGALTRAYPCAECATHFGEIVARRPVDASSGAALRRWVCDAHNEVNARLGKEPFDCASVDARWPGLACDEGDDDEGGCGRRRRRGGGGKDEKDAGTRRAPKPPTRLDDFTR